MRWMACIALAAISCRRLPPGGGDDGGGGGGGGGGGPDTADTADTGDTGVPPGDFLPEEIDDETWADEGYEVVTYRLSPHARDPYDSLFENDRPTFFVMRPMDVSEDEQLPVVVWFHGGAIGDDSSGELPYACVPDRVIENARRAVSDHFVPTALARQRRWVVVVPRNDWCDMWTGWGPDDPVDPERHYGYYHVSRVLDFVLAGGAGFGVSALYGWGTSMGGTGALIAAARYHGEHGGFDAVVSDSAPSSMFWYYDLNHFGTDDEILEHTFGGPPYDENGKPTEAWQRYADASAEYLVADGKLSLPLYTVWNSLDQLNDPEHVEALIAAMDEYYPDEVRHGEHDFAHEAPGEYFHTQSVGSYPPWGYTGLVLLDFLTGSRLEWVEAEAACDEGTAERCEVGTTLTVENSRSLREYSHAAARAASADDGAGTVLCVPLPDGVAPGETVTATLVVTAGGTGDLDQSLKLGSLTYEEDGAVVAEQPFAVSDMLPEATEDLDRAIQQYLATRLELSPASPESGRVCVESAGRATLFVDAVIYERADTANR